jgi:3-mercaptopyruvate sulfurtransferase SseA
MGYNNKFCKYGKSKSPFKEVVANPDPGTQKEDYQVKGTKEYNKLQEEYKGNTAQYLDNRFPKRKNKGESSL